MPSLADRRTRLLRARVVARCPHGRRCVPARGFVGSDATVALAVRAGGLFQWFPGRGASTRPRQLLNGLGYEPSRVRTRQTRPFSRLNGHAPARAAQAPGALAPSNLLWRALSADDAIRAARSNTARNSFHPYAYPPLSFSHSDAPRSAHVPPRFAVPSVHVRPACDGEPSAPALRRFRHVGVPELPDHTTQRPHSARPSTRRTRLAGAPSITFMFVRSATSHLSAAARIQELSVVWFSCTRGAVALPVRFLV